ncbi:MAG: hypothetical protein AAGJ50_00805 [Pseudomonadota bacterium]
MEQNLITAGKSRPLNVSRGNPKAVHFDELTYYDDTIRWPIWKTIVLAVGVSAVLWAAIIGLAVQFLS